MDLNKNNVTLDGLVLSDKRYLELKARQNVIANWVKQIGDKTGVKISLEDLEKVA